jgi:hypothetical protein
MTIKRALPRAPTLTVEEHRRVVQVVTLLVAVSRRVGNSKEKTRGTSLRKKHKQDPQIRGPCFFARKTYHRVTNAVKNHNRKQTNDKKFLYYSMFTRELQ